MRFRDMGKRDKIGPILFYANLASNITIEENGFTFKNSGNMSDFSRKLWVHDQIGNHEA